MENMANIRQKICFDKIYLVFKHSVLLPELLYFKALDTMRLVDQLNFKVSSKLILEMLSIISINNSSLKL